jgi:hypothetical protein
MVTPWLVESGAVAAACKTGAHGLYFKSSIRLCPILCLIEDKIFIHLKSMTYDFYSAMQKTISCIEKFFCIAASSLSALQNRISPF